MDILSIVDHALYCDIVLLEQYIEETFNTIDKNDDKEVSKNDLATFLTNLSGDNRDIRRATAKRLVHAYDGNGNYTLDKTEFRALVLKKLNAENLKQAIKKLQIHMVYRRSEFLEI
jgi:Ca2+-binding EF-hand superfamily protein